jgi:micrococcal nuclease
MYSYNAVVRRIVDGDTLRLDIDLGFNVWLHNIPIRLARIQAPEEDDPEIRQFLEQYLGKKVLLSSHGRDKYGRWIADVFVEVDAGELRQRALSDILLEKGYVVRYGEPSD